MRITNYDSNSQLEEFSAYFTHIYDNYDMLPDFVVFVHPDAQEHQGSNFFGLNSAMGLISNHSKMAQEVLGYYPLSMQYVVDPGRINIKHGWEVLWRRVFGTSYYQDLASQENCVAFDGNGTYRAGNRSLEPCERGISFHVAAQALISAERIRKHSRDFYKKLAHKIYFSSCKCKNYVTFFHFI